MTVERYKRCCFLTWGINTGVNTYKLHQPQWVQKAARAEHREGLIVKDRSE